MPVSDKGSSHLCILPWIHVRLNQDGNVYPCCRASEFVSYGNMKTSKFSDIWNGPVATEVRRKMKAGEKISFCDDCHRLEESGHKSHRQSMNEVYQSYFDRIDLMDSTGQMPNENLVYLDVRASNTCSLKCRSCGPQNSTSWGPDAKAMAGSAIHTPQYKLDLEQIKPLTDSLKAIYFAGGEPLLEIDHYKLLEHFIQTGRTDIELGYNTNFSTLEFAGYRILDLWNKFSKVYVSASLDGIKEQGEFIRKGISWEKIKENYHQLKRRAPHVEFWIFPTITIYNAFHITEAIVEFISLGMLFSPEQIALNVALEPEYLNVNIFDHQDKENLEHHYLKFGNWLDKNVSQELGRHIKKELNKVIEFIQPSGASAHRSHFIKYTLKLDKIRSESTLRLFPELANLFIQKEMHV